MLHSGQSQYRQSANRSRGKDLRDLKLTCWMFRHIHLLSLLSAQKETYSVAVVWHFSSWENLKSRQCTAVQQMPTPYIPKHHLLLLISIFLLLSWFQSFIALQHELNERNNQNRYSATGISSSECWRAGYSRRQFRVPSLPNICSSTAAGRTELCPNIISLKVLGSCDHRKGKQSHPGDLPLSDDERKNHVQMKHAEDSSYPLTAMSLSMLFSSETRSILRYFWSRGTPRRLCLGVIFCNLLISLHFSFFYPTYCK